MDLKYDAFINKSGYYRTSLHLRTCKICSLPQNVKKKVNIMMLKGSSDDIIKTFLFDQFPDNFDHKHILETIRSHRKYLPFLIEDVQVKSIFKRARYIIENRETYDISVEEKAQMISDIEAEMVKEYGTIENDRISLITVMFNELMPLMVTRLREAIVSGSAKDVKYITDASKVLFNISTAMASTGIVLDDNNSTDENVNLGEDENDTDIKEKIVSLRDRINSAIGE